MPSGNHTLNLAFKISNVLSMDDVAVLVKILMYRLPYSYFLPVLFLEKFYFMRDLDYSLLCEVFPQVWSTWYILFILFVKLIKLKLSAVPISTFSISDATSSIVSLTSGDHPHKTFSSMCLMLHFKTTSRYPLLYTWVHSYCTMMRNFQKIHGHTSWNQWHYPWCCCFSTIGLPYESLLKPYNELLFWWFQSLMISPATGNLLIWSSSASSFEIFKFSISIGNMSSSSAICLCKSSSSFVSLKSWSLMLTSPSCSIIFYLSGFSFTNIHESLNSRGRGRLFTPLYHFHPLCRHLDMSQTISAESLLLAVEVAGLEQETFGFQAQVDIMTTWYWWLHLYCCWSSYACSKVSFIALLLLLIITAADKTSTALENLLPSHTSFAPHWLDLMFYVNNTWMFQLQSLHTQ